MISQPLTLPKTAPVKDVAIAAIRQLQGELGLLGVTGVWLFGSVARGDDTAESDIDVAIRTVRRGDWMIKSHTRELLEPFWGGASTCSKFRSNATWSTPSRQTW